LEKIEERIGKGDEEENKSKAEEEIKGRKSQGGGTVDDGVQREGRQGNEKGK
jgi:hypothetical protein